MSKFPMDIKINGSNTIIKLFRKRSGFSNLRAHIFDVR